MEKHSWNRVHCNLKSSSHPSSRWGHSCCLVGDQIVYFGGYADSTYMNDIWSFNTLSMDWTEIETHGQSPCNRSNCSMSYDQANNCIIIFGGGAPNKKRFNSIHLLDWATKQWSQIIPKQNQNAPWQRTYHTAELFYPYLVVFGGEGMTDMDDAWAYNIQTLNWIQLQVQSQTLRPCARRFHSSVKINNQFFVIAGCHGKYRCLNDIWSFDVSELLKSGKNTIKWTQRKVKGNTFLTRWGHSSCVYNENIYIFAGRFSNDLNDLLVIDLKKGTMKAVKTSSQLPKARRRHSACFIGSSMIVFGGFNGQYFNDLHYINLFELKQKVQLNNKQTISKANFEQYINRQQFSDGDLFTAKGQKIFIHKAIIRKHFSTQNKMQEFLVQMSYRSKQEILQIIAYLYKGYGKDTFDNKYLKLAEQFQIQLCENQNDCELQFFKKLFSEHKDFLSIVPKKSGIMSSPVISLAEEDYICFLESMRLLSYSDVSLVFNKQYCLPISRSIVSMNSDYFKYILRSKLDIDNDEIHLHWECSKTCIIVFQVITNYLALGRVITSKQFTFQHWVELIQLAQYYSLDHLKAVCQQQLFSFVHDNCQKLMNLSLQIGLQKLGMYCSDYQIKMMVSKQQKYQIEYNESEDQTLNMKREELLKKVYGLLRFDILQTRIQAQTQMETSFKRKSSDNQEKENYQNHLQF